MAGWQRGPEADMVMKHLNPSRNESLQVPPVMEELLPAGVIPEKACPKSTENTLREWLMNSDDNGVVAKAQDMAFFFKRQGEDEVKEGWTSFNKRQSDTSHTLTSIGYMPMVLAPAHDMDTLNTVVLRCKHMTRTLGHNYVVITVDEALLCKLMELKWANADYQNCLVVRLGGLHTLMTFMGVISKHVQSSGLMEAWIEANVLGSKTSDQVLHGTSYAKVMRVHKITLQSMWRLLLLHCLTSLNFAILDWKTI